MPSPPPSQTSAPPDTPPAIAPSTPSTVHPRGIWRRKTRLGAAIAFVAAVGLMLLILLAPMVVVRLIPKERLTTPLVDLLVENLCPYDNSAQCRATVDSVDWGWDWVGGGFPSAVVNVDNIAVADATPARNPGDAAMVKAEAAAPFIFVKQVRLYVTPWGVFTGGKADVWQVVLSDARLGLLPWIANRFQLHLKLQADDENRWVRADNILIRLKNIQVDVDETTRPIVADAKLHWQSEDKANPRLWLHQVQVDFPAIKERNALFNKPGGTLRLTGWVPTQHPEQLNLNAQLNALHLESMRPWVDALLPAVAPLDGVAIRYPKDLTIAGTVIGSAHYHGDKPVNQRYAADVHLHDFALNDGQQPTLIGIASSRVTASPQQWALSRTPISVLDQQATLQASMAPDAAGNPERWQAVLQAPRLNLAPFATQWNRRVAKRVEPAATLPNLRGTGSLSLHLAGTPMTIQPAGHLQLDQIQLAQASNKKGASSVWSPAISGRMDFTPQLLNIKNAVAKLENGTNAQLNATLNHWWTGRTINPQGTLQAQASFNRFPLAEIKPYLTPQQRAPLRELSGEVAGQFQLRGTLGPLLAGNPQPLLAQSSGELRSAHIRAAVNGSQQPIILDGVRIQLANGLANTTITSATFFGAPSEGLTIDGATLQANYRTGQLALQQGTLVFRPLAVSRLPAILAEAEAWAKAFAPAMAPQVADARQQLSQIQLCSGIVAGQVTIQQGHTTGTVALSDISGQLPNGESLQRIHGRLTVAQTKANAPLSLALSNLSGVWPGHLAWNIDGASTLQNVSLPKLTTLTKPAATQGMVGPWGITAQLTPLTAYGLTPPSPGCPVLATPDATASQPFVVPDGLPTAKLIATGALLPYQGFHLEEGRLTLPDVGTLIAQADVLPVDILNEIIQMQPLVPGTAIPPFATGYHREHLALAQALLPPPMATADLATIPENLQTSSQEEARGDQALTDPDASGNNTPQGDPPLAGTTPTDVASAEKQLSPTTLPTPAAIETPATAAGFPQPRVPGETAPPSPTTVPPKLATPLVLAHIWSPDPLDLKVVTRQWLAPLLPAKSPMVGNPLLLQDNSGTLAFDITTITRERENTLLVGKTEVNNIVLPLLNITDLDGHIEHQGIESQLTIDSFAIPGIDINHIETTLTDTLLFPFHLDNFRGHANQFSVDNWQHWIANVVTPRWVDGVSEPLIKPLLGPAAVKLTPVPVVFYNGDIAVDEAVYDNILMENLKGRLSIHETGYVEMQETSATVAGGNVDFALEADPLKNNYTAARLQLKGVSANALAVALLNAPNQIFGDIDGTITFATQGFTEAEQTKNSNGTAEFVIENGRLPAIAKIETLLAGVNVLRGGVLGFNLNNLVRVIDFNEDNYFASLSGHLNIDKGVATTDDLLSDGENLDLLIEGDIRLLDAHSDLTVFGEMNNELTGGLGWLGRLSLNSVLGYVPGVGYMPFGSKRKGILAYVPGVGYVPGLGGAPGKTTRFKVDLKGNLEQESAIQGFSWLP